MARWPLEPYDERMRTDGIRRLAAAALFMASAANAQTYQERLDVTLVNVDVVATDSHGNRVYGLSQDDFLILENGIPQTITNFSEYRNPAIGPAAPGQSVLRTERPPFHMVLFVDEGVYDRRAQEEIQKSLLGFVQEHVRSYDVVEILSWNRSLRRVLTGSSDLDEITSALDEAFEVARQGAATAPRLNQSDLRYEEEYQRIQDELKVFETQRDEARHPIVPTSKRLAAAEQSENVRLKMNALRVVAMQMAGSSARKLMFILSSSFSRVESTRLFTSDPGVTGVPLNVREFDPERELQRLGSAANAAGVTVYSLYPGTRESDFPQALQDIYRETGGIGSTLSLRAVDTDALAFLSSTTGGVLALTPKGIRDALSGVGEDLSSYYSVAYRSRLQDGESRRLEVVPAVRRDVEFRTQSKVARAEASERMHARVQSNLFRRIASSIRLSVDVAPPTGRRINPKKAVEITVRFPATDLYLLPEDEVAVGRFSISIAAGNEHRGGLTEVSSERRSFEVPIDSAWELDGHEILYKTTVRFDENTTVISVGVRDEHADVAGFARVGIRRSASS